MSSLCFKLALQSQSSDKFDTWDSLSCVEARQVYNVSGAEDTSILQMPSRPESSRSASFSDSGVQDVRREERD